MSNKYVIDLNASVAATNDTNATTGITGDRWKHNNEVTTVLSDGRTLVAGDLLVYNGAVVDKLTDSSISKIVQVNLQANSMSDTKNTAIKIPLNKLEFSSDIEILGINMLGYKSKAPGMEDYHIIQEVKTVGADAGNLSSDFLRFIVDGDNLMIFVSKNYFVQIVREAAVTMSLMVYYR